MKIIGITGGVGSGKSKVLDYLESQYGAYVCQADHVAWKLQEPDTMCYKAIVNFFGNEILNENGTIHRKKLGSIVFQDKIKRQYLNQIMHPAVKQYILNDIEKRRQENQRWYILEAALLLEEHYDEICHELWYIYVDQKHRRERLKSSRGYTDEKIDSIIQSQLSEFSFREKCDRIIDNCGDFENTIRQIDKLMIC